MSRQVTWRGALDFQGFSVHVAVYSNVKSSKIEPEFKLMMEGKGVEQRYLTASGSLVKSGDCSRGIETPNGLRQIPDEALEALKSVERSRLVEASYYATRESLPMELIQESYSIVADDKVAGSEKSVNLLWNGLRHLDLAYVTQVQFRSGSQDRILAIYANERGLVGVTFPFIEDLWGDNIGVGGMVEDQKQAEMFSRFVKSDDARAFSIDDFHSEARARRQKLAEQIINNEPIVVEETVEPNHAADIMAALEAQLA